MAYMDDRRVERAQWKAEGFDRLTHRASVSETSARAQSNAAELEAGTEAINRGMASPFNS